MPRERRTASDGIERPDPAVVDRKVRVRRLKRRLKAAAALALAAAAGTFLACSGRDKNRPNPPPNPTTDEVSNLPAPPDAGTADAAADQDGAVDRTEHRKGMPVPDNLLE
jgi:hypothetical protein